jgi:hypothetical protein
MTIEARKGRETNASCPRETAMSMGAWETNMPERETAAVRRDGEPLTSAVQERWQEEAAAEQHQAAAGEQPLPPAREGTEPVTSPVTNPKTRTSNAVDTDGRQLIVAKVSRAETSHMDPRPLNEPTAKPRLKAVCMPARCLKTGTEHLSTIARWRIIQVTRGGVKVSPDINLERHSCSMMNMRADQQARLAAMKEQLASITAQPQVLWLSAPGEADQGSAEEQLVPAEADLVPAGADKGSAEEQLVPAEADLVPAEADLVPAGAT